MLTADKTNLLRATKRQQLAANSGEKLILKTKNINERVNTDHRCLFIIRLNVLQRPLPQILFMATIIMVTTTINTIIMIIMSIIIALTQTMNMTVHRY